jgi:hypothetical protein
LIFIEAPIAATCRGGGAAATSTRGAAGGVEVRLGSGWGFGGMADGSSVRLFHMHGSPSAWFWLMEKLFLIALEGPDMELKAPKHFELKMYWHTPHLRVTFTCSIFLDLP